LTWDSLEVHESPPLPRTASPDLRRAGGTAGSRPAPPPWKHGCAPRVELAVPVYLTLRGHLFSDDRGLCCASVPRSARRTCC